MSARTLSMCPTTLRFVRAGLDVARRHFLTHSMYIGSSTLRFRGCDTPFKRPAPDGSAVIRAICRRTLGAGRDFRNRPQRNFA